MQDVRGVTINVGDEILYTTSDSGRFREGSVIGFTPTMVRIVGPWGATVKSPQYIVVK